MIHRFTRRASAVLASTRLLVLMCSLSVTMTWAGSLAATVPQGDAIAGRIQGLLRKSVEDLIFVQGGSFKMGDFGQVHSADRLPYTGQSEALPLHEVELDGFSIGRYKVTYEDFDVYTDAKGLPRIATARFDARYRLQPGVPAGVNWAEAKAYCRWVGEMTHLPFDLPTEAQWEYAARDRGKFVVWATSDGGFEVGKSVASDEQYEQFMPSVPSPSVHPNGRFPPSPLGLYDMGLSGFEWADDWFSPDYYSHSPRKNPRGPATGTEKVQRGIDARSADTAMTMYRERRAPMARPFVGHDGQVKSERDVRSGFRCVVNRASPVVP